MERNGPGHLRLANELCTKTTTISDFGLGASSRFWFPRERHVVRYTGNPKARF